MTERDVQVAAVAWSVGVLGTTVLVLVSYLLWWRSEQTKEGQCMRQPATSSPARTPVARNRPR